jgi:hypothetical protein
VLRLRRCTESLCSDVPAAVVDGGARSNAAACGPRRKRRDTGHGSRCEVPPGGELSKSRNGILPGTTTDAGEAVGGRPESSADLVRQLDDDPLRAALEPRSTGDPGARERVCGRRI